MAVSWEALKGWGTSAAPQRGDGYKPPDKRGSSAVCRTRPSNVRAAQLWGCPSPSEPPGNCSTTANERAARPTHPRAKSLPSAATDGSCYHLLWGQQMPGSCCGLGGTGTVRTGWVNDWAQTRHPGTVQRFCWRSAMMGRAWGLCPPQFSLAG